MESRELNISNKINDILQDRRNELPKVDRQIGRWESLKDELSTLKNAFKIWRQHEAGEDKNLSECDELYTKINHDISETLENLKHLKGRFSRPTLNIGVSGVARVGKSTLLQSISGLGEGQIPTGSDLPVTAVRSRIFHSKDESVAVLHLHDYESFRQNVLQPYHKILGLGEAPLSVETFKAYTYPKEATDLQGSKSTSITELKKLKEMQGALSSYQDNLSGQTKRISLEELREYVAYPTAEEEEKAQSSGSVVPRPYLAVKDVEIKCNFPSEEVESLGILDLPGLGELDANAEAHHLAGLKNDVDLVMLVKRPEQGMGFWGEKDGKATNLLDEARGFVENRRDFVYIVINSGGIEESKIKALRGSILRDVNDGVEDKHYQVLEVDAKNEENVSENLLNPVLAHLAERLPVMDQQIREKTTALLNETDHKIKQLLEKIEAVFFKAKPSSLGVSKHEFLEAKVKELHHTLAAKMQAELQNISQRIDQGSEKDNPFKDEIKKIAVNLIGRWIPSGLGRKGGDDDWLQMAADRLSKDKVSGGFLGEEFNRIRVGISKAFIRIDSHFEETLENLWKHLGDDIIRPLLGNLLAGKTGLEVLKEFGRLAKESKEPCPHISQSIRDLLDLRLDYRTQLHHKVRHTLNVLKNEGKDEDGKNITHFTMENTKESKGATLKGMKHIATQAVNNTAEALMKEYKVSDQVIFAAVEQFDDALIRSGESDKEFRRLARSYRDEIWPNAFAGIEAARKRSSAVKEAMKSVREAMA